MVTQNLIISNTTLEVMRFIYTPQANVPLNMQAVRMALDSAVYNYVGTNPHDTLIDATDPLTQALIRTVIKYS